MGRNAFLSLLFGVLVTASGARAGTILVSNNSSGTVGAYTTSGATVNASLITGLSNPGSLTLSGSTCLSRSRAIRSANIPLAAQP